MSEKLTKKLIKTPWLKYIIDGDKTYEGRANIGFWSKLKKGDIFIAYDNKDNDDIKLKVINIKNYSTFGNAWNILRNSLIPDSYLNENNIKPNKKNIDKIYSEFYTDDDLKNGVLAIQIELIKSNNDNKTELDNKSKIKNKKIINDNKKVKDNKTNKDIKMTKTQNKSKSDKKNKNVDIKNLDDVDDVNVDDVDIDNVNVDNVNVDDVDDVDIDNVNVDVDDVNVNVDDVDDVDIDNVNVDDVDDVDIDNVNVDVDDVNVNVDDVNVNVDDVDIDNVNVEDDSNNINYIKPSVKDLNLFKKQKDSELYYKVKITTEILIHPKELTHKISDLIKQKVEDKVEGICVNEGYVKPKSTNILSRSLGHINTENPTSSINYIINYKTDICNPKEGDIFTAIVEYNNKTMVSAYIDDIDTSPLDITLYRQHHLGNTDFIGLTKDDKIRFVVIDSTYNFLDKSITVLGHFINKE